MSVGHAFRHAGRARGEAQSAGRVLVERAPDNCAAHLREQRLECAHHGPTRRGLRHQLLRVDDHQPLERRRARGDLARQRQQVRADDQDACLGLRDHRRQLSAGQSRIQRVTRGTHAHDRVPDFDVRLRIPRESRHAIARAHAETREHQRGVAAAAIELRVTDARNGATLAGCHHLGMRMPLGGVFEELVESQRVRLHRAVVHRHCAASGGIGGEARPTFQCQGMPPAARRRQTTLSLNSYIPGYTFAFGCGASSKAM
jgi:hypothetical protein